jgi:sec-independent protein translocase protein TatA
MPNIGPLELAVVLIVVLLIFGPKRLPGLGKQVGTGMREFKDSISGKDRDDRDEVAPPEPPEPPAAAAAPALDAGGRAVEDVVPATDSTKEAEEQVFGRPD